MKIENVRDTGVERLIGALGGRPRARRLALVSNMGLAQTEAAAARMAMTAVNFMLTEW